MLPSNDTAACENCGEHGPGVRAVTYDAMVDGPGELVTELLCEACAPADRKAVA